MPTTLTQAILDATKATNSGDAATAISIVDQALGGEEISTTDHVQLLDVAAVAHYQANQPSEALDTLKRVPQARLTDRIWYLRGMIYGALGNVRESLLAHQEAVKLNPDHLEALVNIGVHCNRLGLSEQSIQAFKRALELDPTSVPAHNNYANTLKDAGLIREATRVYRETLELHPNLDGTMSNYCYVSQFDPSITLAELRTRHAEWDRRFCQPLKFEWPEHQNVPDPDRRLRVGIVSEDLRHHTVGHYLWPVVSNLPDDLELHFFVLTHRSDDLTEKFRERGTFHMAVRDSNVELSERIQQAEIDVLFDLSGHTSGSRLRMFSMKPAPVQMTWLGYVGTTGVSAIDYKIGSYSSIPRGTESYYEEKVLRFPEPYSHQCYYPGCFGDQEIGPAPSARNGYVTYGSFSSLAKLNEQVLGVWARILRESPSSRLLLKGAGYNSPFVCQRISRAFECLGVDPARVTTEPFAPPPAAFQTYNEIDAVLDPWPFSGCTTTCEALWMGVPIVTWPHQTEASRHTVSFLQALGMVDGVVSSDREYVEAALSLGAAVKRREYLRKTLRDEFINSPACDGPAYGRLLGQMIRSAWKDWCEQDDSHCVGGQV